MSDETTVAESDELTVAESDEPTVPASDVSSDTFPASQRTSPMQYVSCGLPKQPENKKEGKPNIQG